MKPKVELVALWVGVILISINNYRIVRQTLQTFYFSRVKLSVFGKVLLKVRSKLKPRQRHGRVPGLSPNFIAT